jgi:hypothetical protein
MKNILTIDDKIITLNRDEDYWNTLENEIEKFTEQVDVPTNEEIKYKITDESIQKGLEEYEPEHMRAILANFSGREHLGTELEAMLDPEAEQFDKPKAHLEYKEKHNHDGQIGIFHADKGISNDEIAEMIPKSMLTSSAAGRGHRERAIKQYSVKSVSNLLRNNGIIVRTKSAKQFTKRYDDFLSYDPPEKFENAIEFNEWMKEYMNNIPDQDYQKLALVNGFIRTNWYVGDINKSEIPYDLRYFRRLTGNWNNVYFRSMSDLKELVASEKQTLIQQLKEYEPFMTKYWREIINERPDNLFDRNVDSFWDGIYNFEKFLEKNKDLEIVTNEQLHEMYPVIDKIRSFLENEKYFNLHQRRGESNHLTAYALDETTKHNLEALTQLKERGEN